jgi:hypothetical protein
MPGRLDALLFAAGAVAAFLVLAGVGRSRLDGQVPMRVPSTAVANAFPILVAILMAVVPFRGLSKPVAFLATSFVATATYIVSLAAVVRASSKRPAPVA